MAKDLEKKSYALIFYVLVLKLSIAWIVSISCL